MSLNIKNTTVSRKINIERNHVDAPILIYEPELDGIFLDYNTYEYVTYVGLLLSAYGAEWSLSAGPQVLSQSWWDWSTNTLLVSAHATRESPTALIITPELSGKYIGFVETATRDGISVTTYANIVIYIAPDPESPQLATALSGMGGISHRSGVDVTRPVYGWATVTGLSTTRGNWYKNNVNTGNSDYKYSNTANGDTLYWSETAYDLLGNYNSFAPDDSVYGYYSYKWLVSDDMYLYIDNVNDEVKTRINGLSGGSPNMNLFSVKNHTTKTYVRNPNMWLHDKRDQLAAIPVHKSGMVADRPEDYGGVLITPQHLLYCAHAYPHAKNTWIHPSSECVITFVDGNNISLSAIQLHQYKIPLKDFCVAVLDRNMENLGIRVMPIAYNDVLQQNTLVDSASSFPEFAISQGYNSPNNEPWYAPISNYPVQHDVMCYIKDIINPNITYDGVYKNFDYAVYDGDSGTAGLVMYDGNLYLDRVITSTPWAGWIPGNSISAINAGILEADLLAIGIGRLSATTGYTISATPMF